MPCVFRLFKTTIGVGVFLMSLQGCSGNKPTQFTSAIVVPTQPAGGVIPPTEVTGSFLTGVMLEYDGSPVADAKLTIEDTRYETKTSLLGEFALPVIKITAKTIPLKVNSKDKIVLADFEIPQELVKPVSQARIDAGAPPLQGEAANPAAEKLPDGSAPLTTFKQKIGLQIPENVGGTANSKTETDIKRVTPARQKITVAALPNTDALQGKKTGMWTSIDNLSTATAARFEWKEAFSESANVRIVFAKSESELSGWDGLSASTPLWANASQGANVISDFSGCTDTDFRTAANGTMTSAGTVKCGILKSSFPFSGGTDVYARLVGESASEIKLSAVFKIPPQQANAAPVLSAVSSRVGKINKPLLNIPVGLTDADNALNCATAIIVRSGNTNIFAQSGIAVGGAAPNCLISLFPQTGQTGLTELVIRASDGSLTASQSFTVTVQQTAAPLVVVPALADNWINAAENLNGFLVNLTGEAGSTLLLTCVSNCTVANGGTFANSQSILLPDGQALATVRATASGPFQFSSNFTDEYGTTSTTTTTSGIADVTPPTVTFSAPSVPVISPSQTTVYTVTYADIGGSGLAAITLANADVTLSGNSAGCAVNVGGSGLTSRTISISGCTASGALSVSLNDPKAIDVAGNKALATNATTSFTVDNIAPVVTISAPSASLINQTSSAVTYTVTFSDSNTLNAINLTTLTTQITLSGTPVCSKSVAANGSVPNSYIVSLSNCIGNGNVGISVAANAASDAAGNTSPATNSGTTFTVDNIAPVVSIGAPTVVIISSSGSVSFPITVTGSSAVNLLQANVTPAYTGGVSCTVTVINGTTTSPNVTLSACSGTGSVNISLAAGIAQDAAGNASALVGPSATVTVNNTPATLTITSPVPNTQLTATSFNLQGTCDTGLNVVVTSSDISPTTATQTCSSAGGGSYSIPIQLAGADGTKSVLVTSQNDAGLLSSVSRTFVLDSVAPVVTISAPSASLINQTSSAVTYTVTFSDSNTLNTINLTTLTSQITLSGTPVCSKTVAVNGSVPHSYIVSLSNCTGNGTVGISVAANAASDAAGNSSPATNSGTTFTVDNIAPVVSITTAGSPITSATVTTALTGTCENGLTVALGGDVTAGQTTTCASNAFSFASWSVTSGTGTKSVTVSQTDAAGNVGTSSAASFNLQNGWYQEAYIKAANAGAGDSFESSISVSGDTLAVGASNEDSNQTTITNGTTVSSANSAADSGAVYVYRRTGTTWAQEAYVKAANAEVGDTFGVSVSLSGDTLAVGASNEDSNQTTITNGTPASADNSASASGAVYVYRRSGSIWAQEAFIKAANSDSNDSFGYTVSLSGDTLAVGAFSERSNQTTISNGTSASTDNSSPNAGAVYVYRRSGTSWAQEAYIKAANSGTSDHFGMSVSLSGDTLAVAAHQEDSNQITITNGSSASADNSASNSGAVFVYRRSTTNWAQEAYVKAANAETDDRFGVSVSLSGDSLAVGAAQEDSNQNTITNGNTASADNSATDAGAVYVYRRSGTNWDQEAYVKAANTGGNDNFGKYVSLLGDTLAVGAYLEDSNQTTVTNGTFASADNFASDSGAVYVYRRSGTSWTQEAYIKAANSGASDYFGKSVSLSGDTLAVGAAEDSNQTTITNATTASSDNSAIDSGAVYVYRHRDRMFDPDLRISASNTTSVTLAWGANLGSTTTVKVAPAASGTATPAANCAGGTVLNAGDTSYTYGGLTAATKYGFRVCAWDGTNASGGTTIWSETEPIRWYQEAYVKAAIASGGEQFGVSVSLSGDTLAVGAAEKAAQTGAVYVYRRSGTSWAQEAYVQAANAEMFDLFGFSVSLSGNTLAVGAKFEDSNQTSITNGNAASADNSVQKSGAVYVYRRTGTNWSQEAYVKASNAGTDDYFGYSLSLSGDTFAVAAFNEDSNQTTITNGTGASADNSATDSGALYVYRRNGTSWAQEAYLKAANAGAGDQFGYSVSLSGDTLAVGAIGEDSNQSTITNGTGASADNSATDSGALYVYRRNGTSWAQEAYLKAANAGADDKFGDSVSLSGDTLAVGAWYEDSNQNTITNGTSASVDNSAADSGAVYIYRRTGTSWAQEAYVKAANADASDFFGWSVSLSGDTLAVGAFGEDSNQSTITNGTGASANNSAGQAGAVYVYRRSDTSWAQDAFVKAANAEAGDEFGSSVSLSGDSLVVGARYEDSNQTTITNGTTASADNSSTYSGAVYVYRNSARMFDPDLRVSAKTDTSITFAWGANLGSTTTVKVAPAASGTATPSANCSDAGAVTLAAGTTSYTYSGLSSGTKYGFRVCAWDGTNASGGATIWAETSSLAPTLTSATVAGFKPTLSGTCDTTATHTATTTLGSVRNVTCSAGGALSVVVHLPSGSSAFNVTVTSTNSDGTTNSGPVSFSRTASTCPTGYVGVPGSGIAQLGNASASNGNASWWLDTSRDFCVMKYPAKNNNSSTYATSTQTGLPWVGIPRGTSDTTAGSALKACKDAGTNYRLISNTQWQTVARNAESVGANWSGNAVGSGQMAIGHSDFSPGNSLDNNASDTDGYYGTENTAVSSWTQRRTRALSNGEMVWDFGGNVWQWASDNYSDLGLNPTIANTTIEFSNTTYFPAAAGSINRLLFAPDGSFDWSNFTGRMTGGSDGAVTRGGSYSNGSEAGVFAAALHRSVTETLGIIGFRCVFLP